MGIWDEDAITELLDIPEGQELAALIAIGLSLIHIYYLNQFICNLFRIAV